MGLLRPRPPHAAPPLAVETDSLAFDTMPFFICPNCGNRLQSGERTAGLSSRPKGCPKCGFGFLFELLDDYYPAPDAAFFTCDKEGRVLDVGRGASS